MRGTIILGMRDALACWGRFYLEPVEADGVPGCRRRGRRRRRGTGGRCRRRRLDPGLALPGPHREIPLRGGRGRGYEDVAADPATRRLFVLVEAVPNDLPDGPPYHALVEACQRRGAR